MLCAKFVVLEKKSKCKTFTDRQTDRQKICEQKLLAHDQARDLQINDDKGETIKCYVNFASMSETNRTNLVDLISMI